MKFQTIHCLHVGAYTDKLHPTHSEVVYRPLEVAVGALKKAHIYGLCTLKKGKKKKKE